MFVSLKHFIFASALSLAGLSALGAAETAAVAPVAGTTAVVRCFGVSSIAFTADKEQALPLRIVGSLACGETVAILSDNEGYTAQIRTRDGKEGYVARMYLAAEDGTTAPAERPEQAVATPTNGVARWEADAAGCDEFFSHGRHVESITANGITVQVSLQDSGWKYRVNVAISNQSGAKIDVLPGIVSLEELQPNLKSLLNTTAEKVAHTTTHRALWTSANAVPSPSVVTFRAVSASAVGQLDRRTSPAPDDLTPLATLASVDTGSIFRSESVALETIALKSSSLPSGQKTAGVLWFDRDGSARDLTLHVPVGDIVFDFAFSFEHKR